jgi:5-methylthioadenosine/S-adenosylhomocysteine deaminase
MLLGNAARALGLGDSIGSLAPGKKADILIIDPDSPTPVVPSSLFSYFTMTFRGGDVETVLVDGAVVVEKGRMTTVDEEEVGRACVDESRKLWRRNGIAV